MCRTCNTEVHRLLPSGAASEINRSLSWCVAWCIIEPGFYLARTDISSPPNPPRVRACARTFSTIGIVPRRVPLPPPLARPAGPPAFHFRVSNDTGGEPADAVEQPPRSVSWSVLVRGSPSPQMTRSDLPGVTRCRRTRSRKRGIQSHFPGRSDLKSGNGPRGRCNLNRDFGLLPLAVG